MRLKPFAHINEVDWAIMLMNLDGIAPAQRNVRPAGPGQIQETLLPAGNTISAGFVGGNLVSLVQPYIVGKQRGAEVLARPGEQLQSFGSRDGRCQIDRRIQNASGVAGLNRTARRLREEAGQAGGLAWHNVHGDRVTTDRRDVNPGKEFFTDQSFSR